MTVEIGYSIADVNSLKAIDTTNLVTGYCRFMISARTWYMYSSTDVSTGNDVSIITPNSGVGRWLRLLAPIENDTIINEQINTNANIAQSKIAGLVTDLQDKATASHTHLPLDITGFDEKVQDVISTTLVAGNNIGVTYDDAANTITIASSGLEELIEDTVSTLLVAGSNITLTYDDAANTLTIDSEGGSGGGGGVANWDDIDLSTWDGLYN